MERQQEGESVTDFLLGLPVGWELFSEPADDGPLLGLPGTLFCNKRHYSFIPPTYLHVCHIFISKTSMSSVCKCECMFVLLIYLNNPDVLLSLFGQLNQTQ